MPTVQPLLITLEGSWVDQPIAAFDLETTGPDPLTARIVSYAIITLSASDRTLLRAAGIMQPDGFDIPPEAAAVHGITNERALAEGAPYDEGISVITRAFEFIASERWPLVVYNAPYDLTILKREASTAPLPNVVIDPLVIDKTFDRYRKGSRTLGAVAEHYKVDLDDAHDALADAVAAIHVARAMVRTYPQLSERTLNALHFDQVAWYAENTASFEKYLREKKNDPTITLNREWPTRTLP